VPSKEHKETTWEGARLPPSIRGKAGAALHVANGIFKP